MVREVYEELRPALAYVVGAYVAGLVIAGSIATMRRSTVAGIGARGWAFLLIALIVGPGLMVNAVLKENWGRARPDDITAFGGGRTFTAALQPSDQCTHNCSFVAGDPSMGFYLQAFAYVRRRRQRAWLAGGLAAGGLIGLFRIALGAHFLSDVIFSGVVVMLSTAASYAAVSALERRRRLQTATGRRRLAAEGYRALRPIIPRQRTAVMPCLAASARGTRPASQQHLREALGQRIVAARPCRRRPAPRAAGS